jgi:hypothetical protein
MPAGRPTEYSEDILELTHEYLIQCNDAEQADEKLQVNLPTIEGLASYLRISRDTLYEWAKVHAEFSDMLEEIRTNQAEKLINNGLAGRYNSTITKLLLHKHGYTDRSESDVTSGGKPIPLLASMNVPNHDGDQENSSAQETD